MQIKEDPLQLLCEMGILLILGIAKLSGTQAEPIIPHSTDIHIYGGVLMSSHLRDKLAQLLSS